jgi:hypothetical protein
VGGRLEPLPLGTHAGQQPRPQHRTGTAFRTRARRWSRSFGLREPLR